MRFFAACRPWYRPSDVSHCSEFFCIFQIRVSVSSAMFGAVSKVGCKDDGKGDEGGSRLYYYNDINEITVTLAKGLGGV